MPRWLRKISRFLSILAMKLDHFRFVVKKKLGWLGMPVILPYTSFGNSSRFSLRGRVLEDQGLDNPEESDSFWQNFRAMVRRHTYNEIPDVKLVARFEGLAKEVVADKHGYFKIDFELVEPIANPSEWHDVSLELLDKVVPNQGKVEATGKVLISNQKCQFGVISDVDDTIIISHSPHLIKKLRLMLIKNAYTRMPFEGVAALYRALQRGGNGTFNNPIFYVSSSSWNLYDLLVDFCDFRNIPKGPFLLRNSRLDQYKFITSLHRGHKLEKIEQVLSTYKNLNFIFLGDSGQKDPEIYKTVVADFPGRVEAIYIRDVSGEKRHNEIVKIAEELKALGVPMVLVKDSISTAFDAARRGFITKDSIKSIIEDKKHDEMAPEEGITW
jgi:phosphatidate phosphatase APP1